MKWNNLVSVHVIQSGQSSQTVHSESVRVESRGQIKRQAQIPHMLQWNVQIKVFVITVRVNAFVFPGLLELRVSDVR